MYTIFATAIGTLRCNRATEKSLYSCQTPTSSPAYIRRRGEHMCNSRRRCPGCNDSSARKLHNWRRRQNRAIQQALHSWVRDKRNVQDSNVRDFVQKLGPGEAKNWAQDAGAPDWLAHPSKTKPRKPSHPSPTPLADIYDPQHPQTRAAIATALSIQGKSGHGAEERRLITSKIVDTDLNDGGGVNETLHVHFADGGEAFFKPIDGQEVDNEISLGHEYSMQAQHEIGTWKIAQQLGDRYTEMVPPTVLREVNGRLGTLSKKYPGMIPNVFAGEHRQVDPHQMHDAAVFDAITGQRDRHPANTLVYRRSPEHLGISLIDHGYSFTRIGEYPHNYSIWRICQQGSMVKDSSLTEAHLEDLKRLRSTNLDFLRGIIHPDRISDRLLQIDTMIETRKLPPIPELGGFR